MTSNWSSAGMWRVCDYCMRHRRILHVRLSFQCGASNRNCDSWLKSGQSSVPAASNLILVSLISIYYTWNITKIKRNIVKLYLILLWILTFNSFCGILVLTWIVHGNWTEYGSFDCVTLVVVSDVLRIFLSGHGAGTPFRCYGFWSKIFSCKVAWTRANKLF